MLSNYIAPLKQFRSLGRLAWVFYYVFSVWTVYHLYALWRHFRSINAGKYTYHISVIVVLCAFLWMLDAIVNIKARKAHMLTQNATESFSDYYATQWSNAGINIDDYQAIMPLPLVLIGSEKIGLEKGLGGLKYAMKSSFSTGLPIIGAATSRTSKLVTEKTAQLAANPLLPRTVITDFEADKKILLLWSYEELNAVELKLANSSSVVYESNEYRLYSISVSELSEMQIKPELDSVTISQEAGYLLPKAYGNTDDKLWGNVAYRLEKSSALLDTVFTKQESLILSYWVKVIQTDELLPNRSFLVDGERQFSAGIGANPNLLDGWLMVTDTINTEAGKRHEYLIKSRAGTIGRIQLRKTNTDLIHKEESLTFANNIPLR